jgi:hypothetical protein
MQVRLIQARFSASTALMRCYAVLQMSGLHCRLAKQHTECWHSGRMPAVGAPSLRAWYRLECREVRRLASLSAVAHVVCHKRESIGEPNGRWAIPGN